MAPKVARLEMVDSEREREIANATRSRDLEIRNLNEELQKLRTRIQGA